jgi:hypothetical protein
VELKSLINEINNKDLEDFNEEVVKIFFIRMRIIKLKFFEAFKIEDAEVHKS